MVVLLSLIKEIALKPVHVELADESGDIAVLEVILKQVLEFILISNDNGLSS